MRFTGRSCLCLTCRSSESIWGAVPAALEFTGIGKQRQRAGGVAWRAGRVPARCWWGQGGAGAGRWQARNTEGQAAGGGNHGGGVEQSSGGVGGGRRLEGLVCKNRKVQGFHCKTKFPIDLGLK